MKPIQLIKHYLSFSKGEQRGMIILVLIIMIINIIRIYLPESRRLSPVDLMAFNTEISNFEVALEQAKRVAPPDSTKLLHNTRDPSFVIEINRADTLDLQRLRGIGPSFARRITGYRKRLGGIHIRKAAIGGLRHGLCPLSGDREVPYS